MVLYELAIMGAPSNEQVTEVERYLSQVMREMCSSRRQQNSEVTSDRRVPSIDD